MIAEGSNALQVKGRMGHEDIRTTYNIYGHSSTTMRTHLSSVWIAARGQRLSARALVMLGVC